MMLNSAALNGKVSDTLSLRYEMKNDSSEDILVQTQRKLFPLSKTDTNLGSELCQRSSESSQGTNTLNLCKSPVGQSLRLLNCVDSVNCARVLGPSYACLQV